jgi:murein endopeptidase
MDHLHANNLFLELELELDCVPNSTTCSTNSTVKLLHGEVCGAELKKWERSNPKHPLNV